MPREERRDDAGTKGYREVAERLQEMLRGGQLPSGGLLPTERELQAEFGVSRTTVRRALQTLIDSGWASSSPNRGVVGRVGPHLGREKKIAYVDHASAVHQFLFTTLCRDLEEIGHHLVLVNSEGRGTEAALEHAVEAGFAGAIVWPKTGTPDIERMTRIVERLPIVAVNEGLPRFPSDLVTHRNFEGAVQAVAHLASLGRQRVAVAGMMDMVHETHERFSGFLSGLFGAGLQPEVRNFTFCMTSGMGQPDTIALRRRLLDDDRPDSVLVLQDLYVPAVIDAVLSAGLRVPEDVAVVGMGNDVPLDLGGVGLTTVAFDWERIASSCVESLMRRIESPADPFATIEIDCELIVRGSCGADRSAWSSRPYQQGNNLYPYRFAPDFRGLTSLASPSAAEPDASLLTPTSR